MTASYTPTDRPRLAVAGDGTLVAVAEPGRIHVLALPSRTTVSEIGVDTAADDYDLAWVGARLLVLSRYAGACTVHLIDPHGPRSLAEVRMQTAMRLVATVGAHALVIGGQGAAVLTAGDTTLMPYPFASRALPTVAGAAGAQFVVALPGVIEEWDPQTRMPKRRLRLPRPAVLSAVGGSERVVWMVTQQEPSRIDVLPLINRGQPKAHDLPEPIASVSSHPRADVLVCVGAESGRLYAVDLDGRTRLRVLAPPGIERAEAAALVVGRMTGVVAAAQGAAVIAMPLDGREPDAVAGASVPTGGDGATAAAEPATAPVATDDARAPDDAPPPSTVRRLVDLAAVEPIIDDAVEAPVLWSLPTADAPTAAPAPPPRLAASAPPIAAAPSTTRKNLAERFAQVRERRQQVLAGDSRPIAVAPQAAVALDVAPRPGWRDDCVAWARAILAGANDAPPALPPIEHAAQRFDVPRELVAAIALLYGVHLAGEPGVAPVDVARVLGGRWDEALARGQLASRGAVLLERSRLSLVPELRHALDDQP